MINQLTVFLENKPGRLLSLCSTLGEAGINMRALMVADTTEFGIVRIVCDAPQRARELLRAQGYSASITKVLAVQVPDEPGALADILRAADEAGANIEYAYCFLEPARGGAVNVFKVGANEGASAEQALRAAGFVTIEEADIYPSEVA